MLLSETIWNLSIAVFAFGCNTVKITAVKIDNDVITALTEPCVLIEQDYFPFPENERPDDDQFLWKDQILCQVSKETDQGITTRYLTFEGNKACHHLARTHEVTSGLTNFFTADATINWTSGVLHVPDKAIFDISNAPSPVEGGVASKRQLSSTHDYANGVKKVLAVRVSGSDAESLEADEIRMRWFGKLSVASTNFERRFGSKPNGTPFLNIAANVERCTAGTNIFEMPEDTFDDSGNPIIVGGVVDMYFDEITAGQDHSILSDKAQAKLFDELGVVKGDFGHIAFIVPNGMKNWPGAAYASKPGWRSIYQENSFRHMVIMHEVGHNFGFDHSNSQVEESDGTCSIGYGITKACQEKDTYGNNCYNVAKYSQVGWFPDAHALTSPLDEPYWEENLIGLGDYEKDVEGSPVLLRIIGNSTNDYFIGFNRASGINEGTCTFVDKVVVYRKGGIVNDKRAYSTIIASLGAGEKHSLPDWDSSRELNIIVNSIDTTSDPAVANLKVFATCNSDSDCNNDYYCDGEETCVNNMCIFGEPVYCAEPTASPTRFCLDSPLLSLEQKTGGSTPNDVISMFDIDTMSDMFLTAMFVKLKKSKTHTVTIYTKGGSHVGYEVDASAWTVIVDGIILSAEDDTIIQLTPLFVTKDTTHAFLVHVSSLDKGGLVMGKDTTAAIGDEKISDEHMSMKWGQRINGFPFAIDNKGSLFPHIMSGTFFYNVCDSTAASSAPTDPVGTSPPTPSPAEAVTSPPTISPTDAVTSPPTTNPTDVVTSPPTASPTESITSPPTNSPTNVVTSPPTTRPTSPPTTSSTTTSPTLPSTISPPTTSPTNLDTPPPTTSPTSPPATTTPTASPTSPPTTSIPTTISTSSPTTSFPTTSPTNLVTKSPTTNPTSPTTTGPTKFTCTNKDDCVSEDVCKSGICKRIEQGQPKECVYKDIPNCCSSDKPCKADKGCVTFNCKKNECKRQSDLTKCPKIACKEPATCVMSNGKCKYTKIEGCDECSKEGKKCNKSMKCCDQLVCNDKICEAASTCQKKSEKCNKKKKCCGQLVCNDKICEAASTCQKKSDTCNKNNKCCGQLVCNKSICQEAITCQKKNQKCNIKKTCCGKLKCKKKLCKKIE